ncbi:MAG: protein translocase subunit SecD [Cellvibrionaceae bacterium]
MLNRNPLWKNFLILCVIGLGVIYALPNIYPQDPAVQITSQAGGEDVPERILSQAVDALKKENIESFGEEIQNGVAIVRLKESDHQLAAKQAIENVLDHNYVVALNQVPTTPEWLASLGGQPMKKGLDLAGGVHFLMEVDIEAAVAKRQETTATEVRSLLRKERARYQSVNLNRDNTVVAKFATEEFREKADSVLRREFPTYTRESSEEGESFVLRMAMSEQSIREIEDYAISQNLSTLRNRVNELGVSEPIVQRQGRNRIVVELPGVQDTAEAKRIIGKTANLEFRMEAKPDALVSTKEQFEGTNYGSPWLEKDIIITGDSVANATSGFDPQTSAPEVNLTLDSAGGTKMNYATRNDIGRRMGTLLIEYRTEKSIKTNSAGEEVEVIQQIAEKKLINLATVQAALGVQFRITGLDSPQAASELALLMRSGALAAPMYFVRERTIGPSLGQENIDVGVKSVVLGFSLVLIFMLVYYRAFGVAANVALAVNLVLLIACMSIFGATLTLPGIAGIVLTVGMAVDANVLIFSRIREEMKSGASPQQSISAGFDRAIVTILDANITTLIVAFILWGIGSGPVKGFAITLSIGIITSVFTAIVVTRAIVNLMYGGRKVNKLWI